MAKIAILLFSIFFLPTSALAYSGCASTGQTVVFINGISTTRKDAEDTLRKFEFEYQQRIGDSDTKFLLGYNASHLDGKGDLIKSFWQDGFSEGAVWTDYDLETILINLHGELQTQKVLLVGYSQGSYYSNQAYTYLTTHGANKAATGVLNIATPARFVAGGGAHINSDQDTFLSTLEATKLFKPLYRNVHLYEQVSEENLYTVLDDVTRPWPGHSFTRAYLALAPTTIVGGVSSSLSKLSADKDREECFTPPDRTTLYAAKGMLFALADPASVYAKEVGSIVSTGVTIAWGGVTSSFAYLGGWVRGFASDRPEPRTTNLPGSHDVVRVLYGSSLKEDELRDLLGSSQGGAVVLAIPANKPQNSIPTPEAVATTSGEVLGDTTEVTPLIPTQLTTPVVSPGYGGGGPTLPVAVVEVIEETKEENTSTPPAEKDEKEPDVAVISTIVYDESSTDNVDGFNICGGTGCNGFSGFSRQWGWIGIGAKVFDSVMVNLSTGGVGFGETLSGNLRLHIYSASSDPNHRRSNMTFDKGNLLYTSNWLSLNNFATPGNECDQQTPDFTYTACWRPFVFPQTVVFQEGRNYLLIFEADRLSTTQTTDPRWDDYVQLLTLCSGNSFTMHLSETCKGSFNQKMLMKLVRTSSGAPASSVLDIAPPPPDLVPPVISITSGPSEGESVASTSPIEIVFEIVDDSEVSSSCFYDGVQLEPCTSPYAGLSTEGVHIFEIIATDIQDNVSVLRRNFSVLP